AAPSTARAMDKENFMASSALPLVFISGYSPATQPGIYGCRFDPTTGALTAIGSFSGIVNPSYLAVHPTGHWLYAVSETSLASDGRLGSVWALRFEPEPFTLLPINHQPTQGEVPCHLQLDATGRWLLVSNYGTGNVGVLPIQPDGALGEMTDLVQHRGHGPSAERQAAPHAHSATVTPDNRFVIVADLGIDQLVVYQFDAAAGRLRPHTSVNTRPGAGPRHLAFHPSGRQVYVANELDSTVVVYDYEAVSGALHERQVLSTLPPGAPENIVADIHVSPDGGHVYVSNRGHNSLAVFRIGAEGRLTPLAIQPCGGNWPRNFTLAPNGRFILVANQYSDEVSVLPVPQGTAVLGAPVSRLTVSQASCIQWVPDDD
ncbi:MAG: lactonase family protein, partial [Anaerolineales bacterium]